MSETTATRCGVEFPFPPRISIYDLLSKASFSGNNKRIPNAFITYRMSLQRELVSKGCKVSLSELSIMASNAWKHESEVVKQAYINLVNDAKVLYKEMSLKKQNITALKDDNNIDNSADFLNNVVSDNLNS